MTNLTNKGTESGLQESLSFCQELKQKREQRGLSYECVADYLKLDVGTVKRLEQGNVLDFLPITYVRGYYRSYMKMLGMNVAAFESQMSAEFMNKKTVELEEFTLPSTNFDEVQTVPRWKTKYYWITAAVVFFVVFSLVMVVSYKHHHSAVQFPSMVSAHTEHPAKKAVVPPQAVLASIPSSQTAARATKAHAPSAAVKKSPEADTQGMNFMIQSIPVDLGTSSK
jgi:cytoskeleton protein RodZ